MDYELIEQELKFCVAHDHTLGKSDNNALYQVIDCAVAGHDVSATVAPFCRKQDGREAYLAIVTQHAGKSVWDRVANHGENDWSRYSTNIDSLANLKTYMHPARL